MAVWQELSEVRDLGCSLFLLDCICSLYREFYYTYLRFVSPLLFAFWSTNLFGLDNELFRQGSPFNCVSHSA